MSNATQKGNKKKNATTTTSTTKQRYEEPEVCVVIGVKVVTAVCTIVLYSILCLRMFAAMNPVTSNGVYNPN